MKYCLLLVLPLLVIADLAFPPRLAQPKLIRLKDFRKVQSLNNEFVICDFTGLVKQHGYPAEEHKVTTKDGYRITFHRIPGSPRDPKRKGKPVIFIQHGITASSDGWVLMGPKKDLAFLAADAGFDVWVGNVRGNTYAREHVRLSADTDPEFWKFSYHQIAMYDIPAMLDYILAVTRQKSLTYIGHSQGTTVSYALLSMKPEYNKKINLLISLSPITIWVKNLPSIPQLAVDNVEYFKSVMEQMGKYEIFPQSSINVLVGNQVCKDNLPLQPICIATLFQAFGISLQQFNSTAISTILKYNPAGTTMQSFHHYAQNIRNKGVFRAYDWGNPMKNYQEYNQTTPIIYNLKNVKVPAALFYGREDILSGSQEAMELRKHLTYVVSVEEVADISFNHLDFVYAKDIKRLLNDRILRLAIKFSSSSTSHHQPQQPKYQLPHYQQPKPQLPRPQQPKSQWQRPQQPKYQQPKPQTPKGGQPKTPQYQWPKYPQTRQKKFWKTPYVLYWPYLQWPYAIQIKI